MRTLKTLKCGWSSNSAAHSKASKIGNAVPHIMMASTKAYPAYPNERPRWDSYSEVVAQA